LLVCILLSAAASYLLKLGATTEEIGKTGIFELATNRMTILGAVCYVATFGFYALALQKVPLSLAQPVITGGASLVTAVVSIIYLQETLGAVNWLGLILISAGLYMLFHGRL
jgi:multidrug transporter EmrE-like cation transporter